jgi:hypothetical protein
VVEVYLFLVLLCLPMDWFSPTGSVFREFGAKPAAPLLVCGAVIILVLRPSMILRLSKPACYAALMLAVVFLSGLIAFLANLLLSWSRFGGAKDPVFQFSAQTALFSAFAFVVVVHARLFRDCRWRSYLVAILPTVITIHLSVFLLEAVGAVSHTNGWLSLFRTVGSSAIDRPSGLMSEPSYFGAFAALYGLPLLVVPSRGRRMGHWAFGGMLFAAAILRRAKTVVPVALAGCAALMWRQGRAALRPRYIFGVSTLLVISLCVIVSNGALDIQGNLSSAMRIGSTALGLSIAGRGYGLTGIGFGQFHFFYNEKYASQFLFASEEALTLMSGGAEFRASTYNLFVRLLVETGIVGISLFLFFLHRVASRVRYDCRSCALFALLLIIGSLGFLCTQDTYFYPPLAVGLALALGCAADPDRRLNVPEIVLALRRSSSDAY